MLVWHLACFEWVCRDHRNNGRCVCKRWFAVRVGDVTQEIQVRVDKHALCHPIRWQVEHTWNVDTTIRWPVSWY